ncbi:MAG: hypothetical protein IPJ34_40855 [Myxococcales bacterium]|nr:hypothetical protein [Myxococcales bacterium]
MLFELPRKGDGSKLDAELDSALTLARHRSPKDRPSAVELRAELLKLHLQARPTELGYREDAAKHASALPDRLRQLAIDALVGLRIGLPSRRRTRYSLLAFFLENALQVAVRRDAVVQARFFDALGERGTTMLNVVSHVRLPSAGPAWTRLVGEGGRSKRLGRLQRVRTPN